MCKLALAKTSDETAYKVVVSMLRHQENVVAGHSTGIAWHDREGVHLRRTLGKINIYLKQYPDTPRSNLSLGHSRYATIGAVTIDNQHPIRIYYRGRRIGYGVHNGTFINYRDYEHLRNNNLTNKTDSALLFTLYSLILESTGDSPNNRLSALGTLQELLSGVNGVAEQNIILLFDDGTVLFSGNKITYKEKPSFVGLMTFGFKNSVSNDKLYSLDGFRVLSHPWVSGVLPFTPHQPPREPKSSLGVNDWWWGDLLVADERLSNHSAQEEVVSTTIETNNTKNIIYADERPRRIIAREFTKRRHAKRYAEQLKKATKINYRVERRSNAWVVRVCEPGGDAR
jgi:predicted glutamine amidotransferase